MNPREQKQMNDTLATLQQRGDIFTRNMLNSKLRVAQMQMALKEADALIVANRDKTKKKAIGLLNLHVLTPNDAYQRADGLNPTKLADINQKKLVANLEARLNKALIRHSETVNENNGIKHKVDKLRRKRLNDNFNRLSLEKKLRRLQELMDKVMETAAEASDQREKAAEAKNALLSVNIDEAAVFNEEYNDLGAYIDNQNELLEESIAKAAKAVKFDDSEEDYIDTRGALTVENEKEIKEKLLELDELKKKHIEDKKAAEAKINMYNQDFADLRAVSMLDDYDKIVAVFCKNEEETFSMFNFIQTVNQETDHILEQHARLEEEIMSYADDQKAKEQERKDIVESYDRQVKEAKEERERAIGLSSDEQKTVEKIAKKVQTLFYKIQCDQLLESGNKAGGKGTGAAISSESRLAVLSGQGVTENNILHFMGLIEERAVQIIGEYVRAESQGGGSKAGSRTGSRAGGGRRPSISHGPKDPSEIRNMPTALEIDSESEEEDDDKPKSIEYMRKTMQEKTLNASAGRGQGSRSKKNVRGKK
ncbi:hypothetical protein TrVE_jg6525 [Triparma verrucosa]|uniref:ODAD1 central coiled coil region domain-containing protein n=1 Tax=Triparma verrucosa TaxID=1606542 RepID=A0A9W7FGB2_9STRA|nr:hypothetical protein TrVE_jg6525 [Triparma verrucosa]